MSYEINSLNDQGQGITYVNDKITFVDKVIPGDIIELEVTKEYKKYNIAKVIKYVSKSKDRVNSFCPYYDKCGGCHLQNISYEDTLKFKREKLENILKKFANIDINIEIVKSDIVNNYRNKITLKIINKKIGFYEYNSNDLIEIDKCLIASNSINEFIKILKDFNINNGEVIIRSNYNDELLINIISKDKIIIPNNNLKIVGILHNNKLIYGEDHFMEIINNKFFEVSYDSFFQINRNITSKMFDYIRNNILKNKNVIDLYCGVGTLGINVSDISNNIYGVEIVENAVLNSIKNSKINKVNNTKYMLGSANKTIDKIDDNIDVVIIDPPRSGLTKKEIDIINNMKVKQIIYVSCDPITLSRDLKLFSTDFDIKDIKGFDMFPYTYHCESITVLEKR